MVPVASAAHSERLARRIHIRGVVQGVGFRPHVFRLARAHGLSGWVLNGDDGVRIHVEGTRTQLDTFECALRAVPPPAAQIAAIDSAPAAVVALSAFEIRDSEATDHPTTRIAPDLPVCAECLIELFDPGNRRAGYAYINCTNCGPRFSIVRALPYDRAETTMAGWALCGACANEYENPNDRRFHAQPVACPDCGPDYLFVQPGVPDRVRGVEAIRLAARWLVDGRILAVKGIGGYHLVCDADNAAAVLLLRERKFRKEKAFAVMVRDVAVAGRTVRLTPDAQALLESPPRPIVLARAERAMPGVAPDTGDLGVMLPYAPIHHVLFASGAPERLVVTSGNRSNEPIAYEDDEALEHLGGLADAFLMGERPIARRVDDSVARVGTHGRTILRRSRGLAPGVVAMLPTDRPILAVGGDLKNAVTLVVDGQAYVSQHIGDLSQQPSRRAFEETIRDLMSMYGVEWRDVTVVHDQHPEYASTAFATSTSPQQLVSVQHHRAHVASVLAEHQAFDRRVLGIAFDGTGYGDDGAIWGGEFFVGSVRAGFERVAHLRTAMLAGGDAAAQSPVQAAAGFLEQLNLDLDLAAAPFHFPPRYAEACTLLRSGRRTFRTTSVGRLFDAAAALLGFTRAITFEGQAAMWLEQLGRGDTRPRLELPCSFSGSEIDWRELLTAMIQARTAGVPVATAARAFHRAFARVVARAITELTCRHGLDTVALSGGVVQNELWLEELRVALLPSRVTLWLNHEVPPNDGGLSIGQATLTLARPTTVD